MFLPKSKLEAVLQLFAILVIVTALITAVSTLHLAVGTYELSRT
jgi:cell division protein FtsL